MAMAQHSAVLGNVSDDLKHLAVKALARFIGTTATSYGAEIGQRLRLTEINIWERVGFPQEAQTVCEIEVRKGENFFQRAIIIAHYCLQICVIFMAHFTADVQRSLSIRKHLLSLIRCGL